MEKVISSFIPVTNFERTLETRDVSEITGLTMSGVNQAAKYGNLPNEKRVHKNKVIRFYSPTDVSYFQVKRERRLKQKLNEQ